eukprot:s790_g19.t2
MEPTPAKEISQTKQESSFCEGVFCLQKRPFCPLLQLMALKKTVLDSKYIREFDVGQWTYGFISDSLARLGKRETSKMNADQYAAFQNSPFMQGVRKTEDLCWTFTCINYYKACHHLKCSDMSRTTTRSEVLGIDEFATLEEVKKAYKKLSLVYHPDKTSGLSTEQKEEYAAIFIELKNAYLTLGDNPTRRQYDRERDRDKASYEVNGFKPKTRAQFDASEVLKKLQELLQQHEMQKPPGKHIDVPMAVKLEKFFYGGHKGIRRSRRDFGGLKDEIRVYRVDIPRGATEPHDVTFRSGGDHHEDRLLQQME